MGYWKPILAGHRQSSCPVGFQWENLMDQSSNDLPTGESVAQGYVRSILRGPEMVDVRSRKQEIWLRPAQAAWESP